MKNKGVIIFVTLLSGILIGWLLFHSPNKKEEPVQNQEVAANEVWTCSMHPQIRKSEPGKCPLCGMDLIPLTGKSSSSIDSSAVQLSAEAVQLANVMTSVVSKHKAVKEVRLYGKVQADERLFQAQVAHVSGRIEKLSVNFTGESVVKGQVLAEIYSPELINAEQEFLETLKTKQLQPELYEASKEKLRQWKLSENQITAIETSGRITNVSEVLSNTSGTVTARKVNAGDYVTQGTVLYDVSDLSTVWVLFDAYESDLPFLNKGEKISFTVQAMPGVKFNGTIAFIDPLIDPVTRVAKIRIETENKGGKLKPEMFATGIISSGLTGYQNQIIIPKSAVLWTGKRSVVYVKSEADKFVFKMTEVELGPMLGESYVILDGLSEGEEIVTNGTFSVDAAAQLEGKPSMMNQSGSETKKMDMPGMDMPAQNK
jgi:membrane fusion protein, copper/silver efflux system